MAEQELALGLALPFQREIPLMSDLCSGIPHRKLGQNLEWSEALPVQSRVLHLLSSQVSLPDKSLTFLILSQVSASPGTLDPAIMAPRKWAGQVPI